MTSPAVSLPMYDFPEIRAATDAVWAAIRARLVAGGIAAPAALDRRADHAAVWEAPDLLLSQTCGYPYVTRLRGRVRLVATPVYRAPGCEGPRYRSVLVVRADDPARGLADLRGRRAAVNAGDSQSGMSALRAAVAPLATDGRFFGAVLSSGGHAASALAVAEGRADIAALDCVSWAHLAAHRAPLGRALRVLGTTAPAPALPFVTAATRPEPEVAALRAALAGAIADPALRPACDTLLLDGVEVLDDAAYDAITAMEDAARHAGYPVLA